VIPRAALVGAVTVGAMCVIAAGILAVAFRFRRRNGRGPFA
jgi:hypothetical protein